MKAYGIFDGGGVKGAALAGCLAAAQDRGIDFQGFGGSSAGAIVALLAAVGYRGEEIRDILLSDLRPLATLDDEGAKLGRLRTSTSRLAGAVSGGRGILRGAKRGASALWHSRVLLSLFRYGSGVYESRRLSTLLRDLISRKYPDLGQPPTFQELHKMGARDLKVLAADLSTARAAVFSRTDVSYGSSVIGAVVASASYPFLFRPRLDIEKRILADGGLASNLPAFLYASEYKRTRWPILAFDLVSEEASVGEEGLASFCGRMLTTALEASDGLLAKVVPGVHLVSVEIPQTIHTLKFDLSDDEIRRLYDLGYRATSEFLSSFHPLVETRKAGEDLKRGLLVNYGPPRKFQPVLWALIERVKQTTAARGLRAAIMLPTGRGTRIVTYTFGFRSLDTDTDLELRERSGVTGQALEARGVVIADLLSNNGDDDTWGLTEEQQRLVPPDRRSLICIPIRTDSQAGGDIPLATLAVDSSTPLAETGWLAPSSMTLGQEEILRVPADLVITMEEWSSVIGRLLFQ